MSKTTYILGAGFSYPAKMPLQTKLLSEIFNFNPDVSNPRATEYFDVVQSLKNFFSIFGNREIDSIDIEDVFTIFDRAYLYEENFQKYGRDELYKLRQGLVDLIITIIDSHQQQKLPNGYSVFAQKLSELRNSIENKIAVLSLNWDTLLEQSLLELNEEKLKVDYCFYTYGFDEEYIPHINLKARGFNNIKVLKLHGSINWLFCSNCGRMYVDENISIGIEKRCCSYCTKYTSIVSEKCLYNLQPFIVTPTLLKKFENLHIKSTWNNAFIELQESDQIVIIGYSLPKADYEFMYLLKKAIEYDKRITVVLAPSDKESETEKRYRSLLGDTIDFCFDGFEKWVNKI